MRAARSLDINRLNREGCLRPGFWDGGQWTRDAEHVAKIVSGPPPIRIILSYSITQHGGERRDVEQPIAIIWMPCRFGGRRPYFLCPGCGCGRRVSKLYGVGSTSYAAIATGSLMRCSARYTMTGPYAGRSGLGVSVSRAAPAHLRAALV